MELQAAGRSDAATRSQDGHSEAPYGTDLRRGSRPCFTFLGNAREELGTEKKFDSALEQCD